MIRNLLATTALATLVSTGVFAQDATQPAQPAAPTTEQTAPAAPVVRADGFLASKIIGETVYNGTGDDAEKIGDVNDIVIAADGNIESVVIGVGGFLGIGEKDVAVNFQDVDWADRDGDRWLVVATTKEQLEQQPAFDRTPYEPAVAATGSEVPASDSTAQAPLPAAPAEQGASDTAQAPVTSSDQPATDTAQAPAAPADSSQPATDTAQAPAAPADSSQPSTDTAQAPAATDTTTTAAIDKSTLTELPMDGVRAEDLVGTTVYGANDENIGEIGDVVLTADGKIDAYLVDVGGFLGMGEKEVAIGSDNLAFMTDKDGNKYLYTTFSKEQLDAAPTYDESSWAEKRDEQRLIMTQ
jgi:sporulation protein YlmC with PRC-barrel domain